MFWKRFWWLKGGYKDVDLRSVLHLDGTDLVEAPLHDVLALQHELAALPLEVLLLPHGDLELAHLLHLLSVHGCCLSRGALQSGMMETWTRVDGCGQSHGVSPNCKA